MELFFFESFCYISYLSSDKKLKFYQFSQLKYGRISFFYSHITKKSHIRRKEVVKKKTKTKEDTINECVVGEARKK